MLGNRRTLTVVKSVAVKTAKRGTKKTLYGSRRNTNTTSENSSELRHNNNYYYYRGITSNGHASRRRRSHDFRFQNDSASSRKNRLVPVRGGGNNRFLNSIFVCRRLRGMADPMFDYQFRLILIGDSTVGKSSLLKFFNDGKFVEVTSTSRLFFL